MPGRRADRSQIRRRRRQDHDSNNPPGTALAIGEQVLIIDLDPQGNASTGLASTAAIAAIRLMM
jgi:hypothetical protein